MDKQEKILTQGIKFIVRDNGSKNEFEEGFTNHVPFILDVNEIQVRLFRESVQAENDHGADFEIIREDIGFITSKNRFVDAKEAMEIAIKARQITSPVDLVMAMKNRIKMAKSNPNEYGGESYIKHLESEIKAIDIAQTELKPEDLY
ncbi:MAG: hypothetical protein ACRCXK_01385 [Wohlfahrtiimonas sp.]